MVPEYFPKSRNITFQRFTRLSGVNSRPLSWSPEMSTNERAEIKPGFVPDRLIVRNDLSRFLIIDQIDERFAVRKYAT